MAERSNAGVRMPPMMNKHIIHTLGVFAVSDAHHVGSNPTIITNREKRFSGGFGSNKDNLGINNQEK